jgi:hypothetical protein
MNTAYSPKKEIYRQANNQTVQTNRRPSDNKERKGKNEQITNKYIHNTSLAPSRNTALRGMCMRSKSSDRAESRKD